MLAAPGQLVKLVVQDLALVQATWPARYQPGVSPVIYNFACEIMGLKKKKITDRPPTISSGTDGQVVRGSGPRGRPHASPAMMRRRDSDASVISKPGCVCFHLCVFALIKFDLPKTPVPRWRRLKLLPGILQERGSAIGQHLFETHPRFARETQASNVARR